MGINSKAKILEDLLAIRYLEINKWEQQYRKLDHSLEMDLKDKASLEMLMQLRS